jgi:hypothetical protein
MSRAVHRSTGTTALAVVTARPTGARHSSLNVEIEGE